MVETLCNTGHLYYAALRVSLCSLRYGFISRSRFSLEANACSNARETTVFPTEVSVPVIKKRFSITNSTVMLHKYKQENN